MRILAFPLIFGLAAVLPACGGAQLPVGAVGTPPQSNASAIGHPDGRWISPLAKHEELLYVSDFATASVMIYSFRRSKLVATITGFNQPASLCVDDAGDVFVPDYGTTNIYEYAHGETSPSKILTDSYGEPQACSSDPTTGNLAVADSSGGVLVYGYGSGSPTVFTNSSFYTYNAVAYDAKGNLFADGFFAIRGGGQAEYAELPKGGATLESIALNKTVNAPSGLQWDGKYLAICENLNELGKPNVIYRYSVSPSGLTRQGKTILNNTRDVNQFWVTSSSSARTVVGADSFADAVSYWVYPAGGTAYKTITKGISQPVGVAVSKGEQ